MNKKERNKVFSYDNDWNLLFDKFINSSYDLKKDLFNFLLY